MDIQVRRNKINNHLGEIIYEEHELEVWHSAIILGSVLSYWHCEILNS